MFDRLDPRSFETREPGPGDPREAEELDPRDVFTSGLDLPRGRERERLYVQDHAYDVRGSEARALATIGTFRVVPASDLRDDAGRAGDLRHGDLEHLRSEDLIRRVAPVDGDRRTALVALTERGRELLERHRIPDREPAQRFYAGPAKARELSHDAQLYRAYVRCAESLHAQGARTQRYARTRGTAAHRGTAPVPWRGRHRTAALVHGRVSDGARAARARVRSGRRAPCGGRR